MTLVTIRSGYNPARPEDFVRYHADRSSYEVTTRPEPGLATAFEIEESVDAGRTIWRIAAVETGRTGGPADPEADFFLTWAFRPLLLIAPSSHYPRLGGVGHDVLPEAAAMWIAHPETEAEGAPHRLESALNPGYFLTHMFDEWAPRTDGPLGLCTAAAKGPTRDFLWFVEPVGQASRTPARPRRTARPVT